MKKGRKKIRWQQIIAMALMLLAGAVCGALMMTYIDQCFGNETPGWQGIVMLAGLFFGMYFMILVQTVVHEAGHLVFGLISGYRFTSFRIGSLMWIREGEKIRLRRMSLAGTGGQCLMEPPAWGDGEIPVTLYNLGGSILNTLISLVFLALYWLVGKGTAWGILLLMGSLLGITFALVNGIPLRMGMVDNDGYNALSLRKDPAARRAFWGQLQVNAQIAKGTRVKDMPREWFSKPSDQELQNSLVVAVAIFDCNRLMDEHRFEEAEARMAELMEKKTGMVDLYRNLLLCDRIYIELVGQNREEVLDGWMSREFDKFLKSMRAYPTVVRTQYVYTLLGKGNLAEAEKYKSQFERIAKTHPYPCEIDSERELMDIAEQKAER